MQAKTAPPTAISFVNNPPVMNQCDMLKDIATKDKPEKTPNINEWSIIFFVKA